MILKAARAQQQAKELADRGDFDTAKRLLSTTAAELRRHAPGSARPDELLRQADFLDSSTDMKSPASYTPGARKDLHFPPPGPGPGR